MEVWPSGLWHCFAKAKGVKPPHVRIVSLPPTGYSEMATQVIWDHLTKVRFLLARPMHLSYNGSTTAFQAVSAVSTTARCSKKYMKLFSVKQYADKLGISRQAVLKQIKKGKLKAQQVGKVWIIMGF